MRLWGGILIFVLVLSMLFSCRVEKRLHRPGYHVEWHKKPSSIANQSAEKQIEPPQLIHNENHLPSDDLLAEINTSLWQEHTMQAFNESRESKPEETMLPRLVPDSLEQPCAVLLFKDMSKVRALVISIQDGVLEYELCDDSHDVVQSCKLDDLLEISFEEYVESGLSASSDFNSPDSRYPMSEDDKASKDKKPLEPFGIFSLIVSIIFLLFESAIWVIALSTVLAFIGMLQYLIAPDKYSAGWISIIAFVITAVLIVMLLI